MKTRTQTTAAAAGVEDYDITLHNRAVPGGFTNYNLAIWPMQVIAYGLGVVALLLVVRRGGGPGRAIWGILSFYWLWMGVAYHVIYFAPINPAAYGFGLAFIIQGILLARIGAAKREISFRVRSDCSTVCGALFILYAMLVYPILGSIAGHGFPQAPVFGVAPCPTTIFTLGLLLWTERRVPGYVLIIPSLWSLVGFLAAINLGIREDFGLLLAGLIAVPLILLRGRKPALAKPATPQPGS